MTKLCFLSQIAALLCPLLLSGQTTSGLISGTVTDPSSAVIIGAKITLTNESTGARRETVTSESGFYSFNSVQPGTYTLVVAQEGFTTFRQTKMVLIANQRLPANARLRLGATTESVEVTAHGTAVETSSAERGGIITAAQMATVQLKGRDFMGMLKLVPGVVDDKINSREEPTLNALTGLYIHGQRTRANSLTLDGITTADSGSNTGPFFEPSMDAIAEVQVQANAQQAEYGRNSGAKINVVMKSGTKAFHGSGYWFKRNEALNANTFFNNLNRLDKPVQRYDLWGYTVGGPVPIKNREKLFFFFSQEGSPKSQLLPLTQLTVPTPLERKGDFSQTLESDGRLKAIRDPITGRPFPDNIIPPARIDKNGQAIMNLFPSPNTSSPTFQFNYLFQDKVERPRHVETLRLDYNIDSKTTLYWRGITSQEEFKGGTGFTGAAANWPQFLILYSVPGRGFATNLTRVINPTTVFEFTWGMNRGIQNRGPLNDVSLRANQRGPSGLGGLGQLYPGVNAVDAIAVNGKPVGDIVPNASFGGVPNAANLSVDKKYPMNGRNNFWNYTANLSHVRGSHNLKTGIYYEFTSRNSSQSSTFNGSFDFGRSTSNPLDTNWAYSNAMLGVFQSYSESSARPFAESRFNTVEWYVQDNWKATRRLTLDFGIRFYLLQPTYESRDLVSGFVLDRWNAADAPLFYRPGRVGADRVAVNPLTGATTYATLIGAYVPGSGDIVNGMVVARNNPNYPRGMMDNRKVQYAPRFGFAFDVFGNGRTAIRGGGAILYDRVRTGQVEELGASPPLLFTPVEYYNTISNYLQAGTSLFPGDVKGIVRSGEVPSVYNWNVGIQQSLGFDTVFDIAYVGNVSRHYEVTRDYNAIPYGARFLPQNQDPTNPGRPLPDNFFRPFRGYGSIGVVEQSSTSNYHSMQVQANRRFARSLQYAVAWTWSKTMGYTDDIGSIANFMPIRVWNYGKLGYDVTHNVSISYTWDLPKVSPRWSNPLSRHVLDNWQLSGVTNFISGRPLGIGLATTDGADITGGGDGARVVALENPILPKSQRTFNRFFNTGAFGRPAQGTTGNAPKDVIRGPGINNFDISLFKNIPLGSEERRIQFRWELFNVFNHTQFSALDTSARFDPAGKQVNARFGQLTAAHPPRQMQVSIRIIF